ncbi:hypothetical protein AKJ45_00970 [candidate division MSBL1 archaeon SCGC-AAA261F19]|uniref:Nucleic acid-binding protein n=2 Tax=candidate division MSBL1 TaxID=215777 RepID=A0A133VB50_9EURY|nr:hypothetical protein AKJ43_03875 [candidate division MSBL1 archaeon SCGC-AAA261D19]KXB03669.1 hypothetical protein AKJ45_00970 [candidate division MSBL1 archaeon SCGC-AAA261F19]
MGVEKAVSDSGPIIHLSQIDRIQALQITKRLLIPSEVKSELERGDPPIRVGDFDWIEVIDLKGRGNDMAASLAREYGLGLGEAEAITLSIEEDISLIFTDDLDARTAAKRYDLEPHGSIGILLRAYREGLLPEEETIESIQKLHSTSSLYLTLDLVKRGIKAVRGYSKSH